MSRVTSNSCSTRESTDKPRERKISNTHASKITITIVATATRNKAMTTLQKTMLTLIEIDSIKMDSSYQVAVAAVN